jgi:hypothetical protein
MISYGHEIYLDHNLQRVSLNIFNYGTLRIDKYGCMIQLWETENRHICVFDGDLPCLQQALHMFKEEAHLWSSAGAKNLQEPCSGHLGRLS